MEAYSDRVVIKRIDLEFKRASGIILGEIESERETLYGKVIEVGPGKQVDTAGAIPMKTKVGDIIVCAVRAPIKINVKGEEYFYLRESDIVMKLIPEEGEEFTEKSFVVEGNDDVYKGQHAQMLR